MKGGDTKTAEGRGTRSEGGLTKRKQKTKLVKDTESIAKRGKSEREK